jgi:osmotically inducible protein OsmC
MPARTADAEWRGTLTEGSGRVRVASGTLDTPYDFRSRFADGTSTNPEELIGAAHAGCFSMALSNILTKAGTVPDWIRTKATVHLEKQGDAFAISRIDLATEASVPGLDEAAFKGHAETAKTNCPVSKALQAVEITLSAKLSS